MQLGTLGRHELLRRPLVRDRLVQGWFLVTAAAAVGAGFRLVAGSSLSVAGVLVAVGLVTVASALAAAVALALAWRRTQQVVAPPVPWDDQEPAWAIGLRSQNGAAPAMTSSTDGVHATGSPPRFISVDVSPAQVVAGDPVFVRWEAVDADAVVVEAQTDLPALGWTEVPVESTGPLHLTAVGPHGVASASTPPVTVIRSRPLILGDVPAPPAAPSPDPTPSPGSYADPLADVGRHLDDVLSRQHERRARRSGPQLPPAPRSSW